MYKLPKNLYVNTIVKDSDKNIIKYLYSENERLNFMIDEVIEFIKTNFTNDDGTIWHEDMKIIINILGGE